ncbi:MAG: AAA family ATPase [Thermoguttaceae bacterium]|nr:AAA family ATPase [Thermoguttaceae bacterium]
MVKEIKITRYRKLRNITIEFSPRVNAISGTNGTCKTSILHMISNAFRAVTKPDERLNTDCLRIIKGINSLVNPKIESLEKGDKKYFDPANGVKGSLFSVTYYTTPSFSLDFRRHNSRKNARYAIKPVYKRTQKDSLPKCPVIYLGLPRIFPFGESDHDLEKTGIRLPAVYENDVVDLYKKISNINITSQTMQKVQGIKIRADFESEQEGIDSNTISAGEDNLFIILTALVSLKYYYESLKNPDRDVESVLLIDELDVTLHPSWQYELLKIIREYSDKYHIQVVFTTHSLSLLEMVSKRKDAIIYLRNTNKSAVQNLPNPTIYAIERYLKTITREEQYKDKKIPILMEDDEAREFLCAIFDYVEESCPKFRETRTLFHLVQGGIGAENLKHIFKDDYLKMTMQAIGILDGDQNCNLRENRIICLPGNGKSPEQVVMDYIQQIVESDPKIFHDDEEMERLGYTYDFYVKNIVPKIDEIPQKLEEAREKGGSVRGVERKERKDVFNKYSKFFIRLFYYWVRDGQNKKEVNRFLDQFRGLFLELAPLHGIDQNEWTLHNDER